MNRFKRVLAACSALVVLVLAGGCASLPGHDPLQVTVAGIESMPGEGEGLELRLLLKLRVQNPNDSPVDYDGVYVSLDVLGKTFATGVSDQPGTVPRFGEAVIGVPVTVSVLRMVRTVAGMLDGKPVDKITYSMQGKLDGPAFRAWRFKSQGQLNLPGPSTDTAT